MDDVWKSLVVRYVVKCFLQVGTMSGYDNNNFLSRCMIRWLAYSLKDFNYYSITIGEVPHWFSSLFCCVNYMYDSKLQLHCDCDCGCGHCSCRQCDCYDVDCSYYSVELLYVCTKCNKEFYNCSNFTILQLSSILISLKSLCIIQHVSHC